MSKAEVVKLLERDVLRHCVEALATLGVNVERQNTGVGRYPNADGTTREVRFGRKGNLDLVGDIDGRRFELEVKRPRSHGGKLPTPEQYRRMNEINEAGGVAFWVYDPAQLFEMIPLIRAGLRVYISPGGDVCVTDEPPDPTVEGWRET